MEIVIILGLIFFNGILSMSEIAMVSARKSRLETAAKKGSKTAKTALRLANEPDRFLSTIQIGITLIGILTGLYSGEALAGDLAFDVIRFRQLVQLYRKVARRGSGLLQDKDEIGAFDPDEDRHHGQTQFGMQQGVEFFKHGSGVRCSAARFPFRRRG